MSMLEQFQRDVSAVIEATQLPKHKAARLARLVRNVDGRIKKPKSVKCGDLRYNLAELSELLQQTHPAT